MTPHLAGMLLVAAASYLIGSFPTGYLFAKWRHGVDIRLLGSGNVGGSNMRAVEGVWATVVVGVVDLLKGALPVWLALELGLGQKAAAVAALFVVVGHDWPLWLGFRGGRGGASTLGVLLVLFPVGFLWVLALMALGKLTQSVAILHLVGVLTAPLGAAAFGRPGTYVWVLAGLALLMVVKRLEANQRFRAAAAETTSGRVFLNRLLLDRDQK